ncbi:hypothetical protein Csa_023395 [Cucumis sativus]|nr:hypothetical protein Csa_023395 [Cucumis sativus]
MDLSCMRWSSSRVYVAAGVLRCRAAPTPEMKKKMMMGRWRMVWRRIKKRIIMSWRCRAHEMRVQGYDRESYLQNFDDGFTMMMMMGATGEDSDVISRSFSARFAISRPLSS